MDNIRQIVCNNMISLRKANKLTQVELAKKINYSDKAISRWEKGEVLPDYEVLNELAKVYEVEITYFFETHDKIDVQDKERKTINRIFLYILVGFVVFTIATIIFVNLMLFKNMNVWTVFVFAIPVTSIIIYYYNHKFTNNKLLRFVLLSIISWTTITGVYLQLLEYNIWPLFLVGVPIQGCIVFAHLLTGGFKSENDNKKIKKEKKTKQEQEIKEEIKEENS